MRERRSPPRAGRAARVRPGRATTRSTGPAPLDLHGRLYVRPDEVSAGAGADSTGRNVNGWGRRYGCRVRPTLPWAKPRREWLVLALVAVCALSPVFRLNAQDNSRLCLSQALAHGQLSNDGCFGLDHALYKGHEYTDKAPGLSFVELPLVEALQLPPANKLPQRSWKLWVIRLLTSGIVFLALAFVVGRVSEGLAPGFGSISLVTFALGTLIAPFAAMNFDQVPAAALGFGAFLLAWRRRAARGRAARGLRGLLRVRGRSDHGRGRGLPLPHDEVGPGPRALRRGRPAGPRRACGIRLGCIRRPVAGLVQLHRQPVPAGPGGRAVRHPPPERLRRAAGVHRTRRADRRDSRPRGGGVGPRASLAHPPCRGLRHASP